jgi:hypothetical protein
MNRTVIQLDYRGEIRMGPPYYCLMVNGKPFSEKDFFKDYIFDPDKDLIAITEYSHDNSNMKSILWVIDVKSRKAFKISDLVNGIIQPIRFENSLIIYLKEPLGSLAKEYEMNFLEIKPIKID